MSLNFSKKYSLIFIKSAIFIFLLSSFAKTIFCEQIVLNAESLVYDKQKNKVFAKENVTIKYKDLFLKTEYLEYDLEKNIIYITTDTTLSYYNNQLFLKSLVYNISNDTLESLGFYVYYSPWYSYSEKAKIKKEEFLLDNAKITHCGLSRPHYYFSCKKVIIYPNKKIKLSSPKLVLNKTPILWLPYYEISLKPSKDYFIVEPGYDSANGAVVKIKYGRSLTENSDIKFLFDPFSTEKLGLGTEYRYKSDLSTLVLYAYYVTQKEKTQWNLRFNNMFKLPHLWSIRSNLEFISDKQLYYFYEKENWFLVKRELNSSLSFSKDTQKNSFRFSYIRKDIYDDEKEKFVNSSVQTPAEFIIYPTKIKRFSLTESIKIVPEFVEGTTYYKISSENNLSLSLPLRFFYISLTPSFGIKTNYFKEVEREDLFYNIYNFNFPLRYNILNFGSLDIGYNYSIKSFDNKFDFSFSSNVLQNNISSRLDLYHRIGYFRCSTAYNFLKENLYWWKGFSPVNSDVGLSYKSLNFNLHTEYNIAEEMMQNINVSLGWFFKRNIFSLSYGKNFYQPDINFFSTQIDVLVPDNFQLRFRTSNNITKEKFELMNANLEFYKDLHCWEAKIFCNVRKSLSNIISADYVFEVGGYIGLKFKSYVGKGLKTEEVDKQYFPWRE